uniref:Uncharacterized protein n=1 Tax=Cucumis melo TaxID=3656 RepID=A0A9I9E756_CUCME
MERSRKPAIGSLSFIQSPERHVHLPDTADIYCFLPFFFPLCHRLSLQLVNPTTATSAATQCLTTQHCSGATAANVSPMGPYPISTTCTFL